MNEEVPLLHQQGRNMQGYNSQPDEDVRLDDGMVPAVKHPVGNSVDPNGDLYPGLYLFLPTSNNHIGSTVHIVDDLIKMLLGTLGLEMFVKFDKASLSLPFVYAFGLFHVVKLSKENLAATLTRYTREQIDHEAQTLNGQQNVAKAVQRLTFCVSCGGFSAWTIQVNPQQPDSGHRSPLPFKVMIHYLHCMMSMSPLIFVYSHCSHFVLIGFTIAVYLFLMFFMIWDYRCAKEIITSNARYFLRNCHTSLHLETTIRNRITKSYSPNTPWSRSMRQICFVLLCLIVLVGDFVTPIYLSNVDIRVISVGMGSVFLCVLAIVALI